MIAVFLACGGNGTESSQSTSGSGAGKSSVTATGTSSGGSTGSGGGGEKCTPSGALDPMADFSCVGHVTSKAPSGPYITAHVAAFTLPAQDNITIKACSSADVDCTAQPLAMGTTSTGKMVPLKVPVSPSGFDGYFEISGPGLLVTRTFYFPSRTVDFADTLVVFSQSQATIVAQAVGAKLDPSRAIVGVQSNDCADQACSGISFEIDQRDATTSQFYFVGTTPKGDATSTDRASLGLGGFVNVPGGMVTVHGYFAADCAKYGEATILARPGTVTSANFLGPLY